MWQINARFIHMHAKCHQHDYNFHQHEYKCHQHDYNCRRHEYKCHQHDYNCQQHEYKCHQHDCTQQNNGRRRVESGHESCYRRRCRRGRRGHWRCRRGCYQRHQFCRCNNSSRSGRSGRSTVSALSSEQHVLCTKFGFHLPAFFYVKLFLSMYGSTLIILAMCLSEPCNS